MANVHKLAKLRKGYALSIGLLMLQYIEAKAGNKQGVAIATQKKVDNLALQWLGEVKRYAGDK